MARIRFKLTGERQARQMLRNAEDAINNARPALKKISGMQLSEIDEAFKVSGKNILGSPWKRLKTQTIRQKLAQGYDTNILVRTGRLKNSFFVKELKQDKLGITSNVKYFPTHQLGKGRVPRRQILGHSKYMINRALDIFQNYVTKKIR